MELDFLRSRQAKLCESENEKLHAKKFIPVKRSVSVLLQAVATSEGVVVVDLHKGKDSNSNHTSHPTFPRNNKTHDENFEHAMKNTIEYKAKIEQMSRGDAARQGLDSLLEAGQVRGKISFFPSFFHNILVFDMFNIYSRPWEKYPPMEWGILGQWSRLGQKLLGRCAASK